MRIINGIRAILFNIVFYSMTAIFAIVLLMPFMLMKTDGPLRKGIAIYCRCCLFIARWIMGIRHEYRGADIVKADEACILAPAHQSNMDVFLIFLLCPNMTALAKKELFQIPFVGLILKKMDIIRIDRQSGKAHKELDDIAARVAEMGRPLLIYPQATRVVPGQYRKLKPGAYNLQAIMDLPVYSMATNTGLFWKKGFWHRPGTAVLHIVSEMPKDMSRDDFMKKLNQDVVDGSDDLMREAGFGHLLANISKE